MSDEQKYAATLTWHWLRAGMVALAIVFGVPAGCIAWEDHILAEMVARGADPIAAKCGITRPDTSGTGAVCAIAASRRAP